MKIIDGKCVQRIGFFRVTRCSSHRLARLTRRIHLRSSIIITVTTATKVAGHLDATHQRAELAGLLVVLFIRKRRCGTGDTMQTEGEFGRWAPQHQNVSHLLRFRHVHQDIVSSSLIELILRLDRFGLGRSL